MDHALFETAVPNWNQQILNHLAKLEKNYFPGDDDELFLQAYFRMATMLITVKGN